MPRPKRLCECCKQFKPLPKERFCRACKECVLDRLAAEGHLQRVPTARTPRKGSTPGRRGWE